MKLKIITGTILLLFILMVSCQSDEKIEFDRYYSGGSLIYQQHCQNCHGVHGEGLKALIPPLTDSVYFKTNKNKLACFVNSGLKGRLTIANTTFDGQMLPNDLPPIDVAKVLTFITNSFGNKMGTITSEQVNNDLSKCR